MIGWVKIKKLKTNKMKKEKKICDFCKDPEKVACFSIRDNEKKEYQDCMKCYGEILDKGIKQLLTERSEK